MTTSSLQCAYCSKIMIKELKALNCNAKNGHRNVCSRRCGNLLNSKSVKVTCSNCSLTILKKASQIKKSKRGNFFCGISCSASYNNKHKTTGTRRSKLEVWIESQLTSRYPNIPIEYNKTTNGFELDIYIPSLKLAFELNGIFHYEPIYGKDKLERTKKNDVNKFQECQKLGISLCIIDTSSQKYFKVSTSKKYLDVILSFLAKHILLVSSSTT